MNTSAFNSDIPPSAIIRHSYNECLSGFILNDPERVGFAARVLSQAEVPLADHLEDVATAFEDSDKSQDAPTRRQLLATVVQSYVFSGVSVKTDLIRFATETEQIDHVWLAGIVCPTRSLLKDIHPGATTEQRRRYRQLGYRVLSELGLEEGIDYLLRPIDRLL